MILNFTFIHKEHALTIPISSDDITFVDGYSFLRFNIDGYYYGGVINENYKIVVPFTVEKEEEDFTVTTIFKKHKAIYGIKNEEFYLIDLDEVQFEQKEEELTPMNYLMKLDGYDDLDDTKAIIYKDQNYFIYDVSNNKKLSLNFQYLEKQKQTIYGYLAFIPEIYTSELVLRCKLNKEGQIQNPMYLGNVSIWLHPEFLQKEETLTEEVAKIYQKEFTTTFKWDIIKH